MDRTTGYPPTEDYLAIEALAQRTGRPQAEILRETIRDDVDRQERPRLRSLGIVKRADLNGTDVDDWLRANWRPDEEWETEAELPRG